ncbi:MAG TPA: UDP-N-acetylmuramoyl-L-alanyl-D-glutamate--2,6-diaminopimelate ligase [Solirubrobacteraceae bacterium]|jgi:UDP-N-acetylmuramoyl-L-alanyl-D-glutamate--2,6-diaminopimelate ligase|nr:UDP-N-acetylmuramoyl-L-alanyl-D-glutamate--2,6-diaminopimelate ligase [Solirubrobacteraceae bacterium]
MRLQQLFGSDANALPDVDISGLAYDNRAVDPGTLFFCVRGFTRDGHDFAAEAVDRGAVAVVVDHRLDLSVPQVVVSDVRAAMAPTAAAFYGDPTSDLHVAGVTGTNGKTTTAYLIRGLLETDGCQTGLLGTVTSIIGGHEHPVQRTTPEAIDLQRTFREMLDGGDGACAMEVSSHALELHRADAIHFAVAVFTNLTQDHLDFHQTMEDYFQAKRRLFTDMEPAASVINVDDEHGRRLAAELADPITFGIDADQADYRATDIETSLQQTNFVIHTPDGNHPVESPLRGRFNVLNVVGAVAAARAMGVPLDTALSAIRSARQVPGRFQTVDEGQPFAVLVDYAHTPDSLENVLKAARPLADGSLRVVFGAGGDRDRGKRPLMGEIAARLADDVIVTSDNPRSEDPEAIIEEILAGTDRPVQHDPDRRRAIQQAIVSAGPGDVVVIAGKGHEQGQEFENGRKIPFDDVAVAREALRQPN